MTDSLLHQISDHVYWMKPDVPDRPSLCAVVGENMTVMLEGAASDAHARLFLGELAAKNIPVPRYVVLTHWHWDHVFGAAEIGRPLIAHRDTAAQLDMLAGYDWQDAALDERVRTGEEIAFCADNIKLELPAPRQIRIAPAEIVFQDRLELRLGGITCQIEHVGGDHAADSSVIYVAPDKVLFLGDCLYDAIYTPERHFTTKKLFPLLDKISAYDAELYVEGHAPEMMRRADFESFAGKLRLAGTLVDELGADEAAVIAAVTAKTGQAPDEMVREFITLFIAGK